MKVLIADVLVRHREIKLPDICPACGVDFRIATSAVSRIDFRPWSFEGKCLEGVFTPADIERRESEDDVPVEGLEYFCNVCNHSLAKGEFSDVQSRSGPPPGGEEEHEHG